jgi:hypothetical protein
MKAKKKRVGQLYKLVDENGRQVKHKFKWSLLHLEYFFRFLDNLSSATQYYEENCAKLN